MIQSVKPYKIVKASKLLERVPKFDMGGINGLLFKLVRLSIKDACSSKVIPRTQAFEFFSGETWAAICQHFNQRVAPPEPLKYTNLWDWWTPRHICECSKCGAIYLVTLHEADIVFKRCLGHSRPYDETPEYEITSLEEIDGVYSIEDEIDAIL